MELFITDTITSDLRELYLKHLVGKKFVYHSKYGGETIGEIQDVTVGLSYTFDKESSEIFQHNLDKLKSRKRREEVEPKVFPKPSNPWTGYRPTVAIKATSGITYKLKEIFILKENSNDTN